MKHLSIFVLLLLSCSLAAQDELVLPYNATTLTDEQRAMNPTYLAYPTALAEQMPLQICGTDYTPMPFTINANGDQVYFSPGNLQYNAARGSHLCADGMTQQGTWRFAEHQYDYVGDATDGNVKWKGTKCDNSLISEIYDGWIDLFGWGTSGWNSGATCYQPWSIENSNYTPGGSEGNNLTSAYANADWGVYNQISSDPAGTWRTLSYDEWDYLFSTRDNAANLRGQATVNGVAGFLLMPDGWEIPSGISFTPGTDVGFAKNSYILEQWSILEATGAVFLPAGGWRYMGTINYVKSYCYYWSSTVYEKYAWGFGFDTSSADFYYNRRRFLGHAVRLVQDIKRHNRFSVAENKQVMFAPGNLQYQASTKTWRFAEHQYDYVGDATNGNVSEGGVKCDNSKVSSSYSGWIDLFGWGTSGWNSGANAYQPYSTSTSYSNYYPGGNSSNNLTGEYAKADWGVYNQIGTDPAGTWRTLTYDEWNYLFNTRTNAANLKGQATINGVNGFLLLPDGWEVPSGLTFTAGTGVGYDANTYSIVEWNDILEPSGAVFLPAGGHRDGGTVYRVQSNGYYWSATAKSSDDRAWYLLFGTSNAGLGTNYRNYGFSVRLAQDLE